MILYANNLVVNAKKILLHTNIKKKTKKKQKKIPNIIFVNLK